MAITSKIVDGGGSGRRAKVASGGDLHTVPSLYPAFGGEFIARIYRAFMKTSAGSSDMRVNGSTSPQDFYIEAQQESDLYIATLSFAIVDASQTLNKFGNLTALTNGCRLFYSDDTGEVDIHDALKTNFDVIRLCGGNPAFGDGAGAFLANNVSGTAEGYIPVLSFANIFGARSGLLLQAGTNQRVTFRIRDDLSTGMDQMDIIAYGFERLDR